MTDPQTVSGAVEQQRRPENPVEAKLHQYETWYQAFTTSHMPATQLVALSIAEFRKSSRARDGSLTLYDAATANPASFYAAVAECARLGLVSGVTFYYAPFYDKNATGGKAVVGMTDWKGEVQLIHNRGGVEAVACEVIRERDKFAWNPSTMRVPDHNIEENEFGQVGLGEPADRGRLTGVYCYVRYTNGGTSFPTVMSSAQVKKHFAKAKTKKFWGDWEGKYPAENASAWTEEMFKKTAVHRHADSVPLSPEHLAAPKLTAAQAAAEMPAEVAAGYAEQAKIEGHTYELPPGYDDNGGNGGGPNPRTITGRVEQQKAARPPTKTALLDQLGKLFAQCGMPAEPRWHQARLVLAGIFAAGPDAAPVQIQHAKDLTQAQAGVAVAQLEQAIGKARDTELDPHQVMLDLLAEAGWTDPESQGDAGDPESDRDA